MEANEEQEELEEEEDDDEQEESLRSFFCAICGFSQKRSQKRRGRNGVEDIAINDAEEEEDEEDEEEEGVEEEEEEFVQCHRCFVKAHYECLLLAEERLPPLPSPERKKTRERVQTNERSIGHSFSSWTCSSCTAKIDTLSLSRNANMFSKKIDKSFSCVSCEDFVSRRCVRPLHMTMMSCGLWSHTACLFSGNEAYLVDDYTKSGVSNDSKEDASPFSNWDVGMIVLFIRGEEKGSYAIIVERPSNGRVKLKKRESSTSQRDSYSNKSFVTSCSNLKLGVPRRNDTVMVLSGPLKNHVGKIKAVLTGVLDTEVVLDNLPRDVIDLSNVAWLHDSTYANGKSGSIQKASSDESLLDKCSFCKTGGSGLVKCGLSHCHIIFHVPCALSNFNCRSRLMLTHGEVQMILYCNEQEKAESMEIEDVHSEGEVDIFDIKRKANREVAADSVENIEEVELASEETSRTDQIEGTGTLFKQQSNGAWGGQVEERGAEVPLVNHSPLPVHSDAASRVDTSVTAMTIDSNSMECMLQVHWETKGPIELKEKELRLLFSQFGKLVAVSFRPIDHEATVSFSSDHSAHKALLKMNHFTYVISESDHRSVPGSETSHHFTVLQQGSVQVSNLIRNVKLEDIQREFGRYGTVKSVEIDADSSTACVIYRKLKCAKYAVQAMNMHSRKGLSKPGEPLEVALASAAGPVPVGMFIDRTGDTSALRKSSSNNNCDQSSLSSDVQQSAAASTSPATRHLQQFLSSLGHKKARPEPSHRSSNGYFDKANSRLQASTSTKRKEESGDFWDMTSEFGGFESESYSYDDANTSHVSPNARKKKQDVPFAASVSNSSASQGPIASQEDVSHSYLKTLPPTNLISGSQSGRKAANSMQQNKQSISTNVQNNKQVAFMSNSINRISNTARGTGNSSNGLKRKWDTPPASATVLLAPSEETAHPYKPLRPPPSEHRLFATEKKAESSRSNRKPTYVSLKSAVEKTTKKPSGTLANVRSPPVVSVTGTGNTVTTANGKDSLETIRKDASDEITPTDVKFKLAAARDPRRKKI